MVSLAYETELSCRSRVLDDSESGEDGGKIEANLVRGSFSGIGSKREVRDDLRLSEAGFVGSCWSDTALS
jgi:hypothetical protein